MFERFKTNIKLSCKSNLISRIIAAELCIFLLFSLIMIIRNNSFYRKNVLSYLDGISTEVTEIVDLYLEDKGNSLKLIAENPYVKKYLSDFSSPEAARGSEYYEQTVSALRAATEADGDIGFGWIASDSSGIFTTSERKISLLPLYINNAEWYSSIVSNQTSQYVWYAPNLYLGISGEQSISIVTAIKENGNILGYAGIEIFEDTLAKMLDDVSISKGSYPIILSQNGTQLYRSGNPEFSDNFNIYHSTVIKAMDTARHSSFGTESFNLGNSERFLKYSSNFTGWKILIFFDPQTALANPKAFFIQDVIIALCFLALMLIFSSGQIRAVFAHIPALLKNAGSIGSGNYNLKLNCKRQDEFSIMANTIDHLTGEINEKNQLIEKSSYHDSLTGLPNRAGIYNEIKKMITRAKNDSTKFAVIFLNISNFKWINDMLGHNYGDVYLKAFSEKLKTICDSYGFLGRFYSDTFALLAPFEGNIQDITALVAKIKTDFQNSLVVYHDSLYIKFSVGAAIFPDDDYTPDMLLRDADIALNISREHGFGKLEYYNDYAYRKITNRAKIGQQLSYALSNHEMNLYFQPIIRTDSREIHGFEVLLRWHNKELGEISPEDFIPIAEETGSVIPIGTWAFESACRFHKNICNRFNRDFVMSINVSPQQILQPGFSENIRQVLDITQINPELVQLEITETVLIDLIDSAEGIFKKLRNLGIRIALDDFGTGYSSLSYLKNFSIQCLKIDRSFVTDIFDKKKDYDIAESIINMVHNLGIETVAEGVETAGQFRSLSQMSCDYIQGYMVGKALSEQQTIEFIENYNGMHGL